MSNFSKFMLLAVKLKVLSEGFNTLSFVNRATEFSK